MEVEEQFQIIFKLCEFGALNYLGVRYWRKKWIITDDVTNFMQLYLLKSRPKRKVSHFARGALFSLPECGLCVVLSLFTSIHQKHKTEVILDELELIRRFKIRNYWQSGVTNNFRTQWWSNQEKSTTWFSTNCQTLLLCVVVCVSLRPRGCLWLLVMDCKPWCRHTRLPREPHPHIPPGNAPALHAALTLCPASFSG